MAVQKIYWQDPYLCELDARVTGVDGDVVTLDRTIFFAFSGGQQSDSGTIGGYEVREAVWGDDREIRYRVCADHSLRVGDPVRIAIDREKRLRLMRLHFAAELVLELVNQNYSHPEKIGANITTEKARVDFFWSGSIAAIFPVIEDKLKAYVDADFPIVSSFSDEQSERRTWEIIGFARVPCGGTHPRRTGEVGAVALKRNNIGKGKERIEIYLVD